MRKRHLRSEIRGEKVNERKSDPEVIAEVGIHSCINKSPRKSRVNVNCTKEKGRSTRNDSATVPKLRGR